MAVNLIDSSDITVTQTGNNIQLETTVDMAQVESDTSQNTTDIQNIQDGNVYSTSEVNTGKKWIDGKPIYRKVENITTASTDITGWTNLFSIPNIDNLIDCYGYFASVNIKTPIPRYESGTYSINFLVQDGYLKYRCYGFHSYSGYLIVEYTKSS